MHKMQDIAVLRECINAEIEQKLSIPASYGDNIYNSTVVRFKDNINCIISQYASGKLTLDQDLGIRRQMHVHTTDADKKTEVYINRYYNSEKAYKEFEENLSKDWGYEKGKHIFAMEWGDKSEDGVYEYKDKETIADIYKGVSAFMFQRALLKLPTETLTIEFMNVGKGR